MTLLLKTVPLFLFLYTTTFSLQSVEIASDAVEEKVSSQLLREINRNITTQEELPSNQKKFAGYLFSDRISLEEDSLFTFLRPFLKVPQNKYSQAFASFTPEHYGALPTGESKVIQYLLTQSIPSAKVEQNSIILLPLYYKNKLRKSHSNYPNYQQETIGLRVQKNQACGTSSQVQAAISALSTHTLWSKHRGSAYSRGIYLDTSFNHTENNFEYFFGILGGYSRSNIDQYLHYRKDLDYEGDFIMGLLATLCSVYSEKSKGGCPKRIIVTEAHPHFWDFAEILSLKHTSEYSWLALTPQITLTHTNIFVSSINFNKPKNFNLQITSKYFSYVDLLTSVRMQAQKSCFYMKPFLDIGYHKIVMLTNKTFSSRLNNYTQSNSTFTTQTYKGNSDTFLVGCGLSLSCRDNMAILFKYSNEFGKCDFVQAINLSVRWQF